MCVISKQKSPHVSIIASCVYTSMRTFILVSMPTAITLYMSQHYIYIYCSRKSRRPQYFDHLVCGTCIGCVCMCMNSPHIYGSTPCFGSDCKFAAITQTHNKPHSCTYPSSHTQSDQVESRAPWYICWAWERVESLQCSIISIVTKYRI